MTATFRTYVPADAAAVAALANDLEVHFGGPPLFSAHDAEEWIRRAGDPALGTRLAIGDDGMVVGYALVSPPAAGGVEARANGAVHPGWRGRGIGRALMTWQSERIAEIYERTVPDAAWTVRVGALRGDTAAERLYRRFGFTPVRYWFGMEAPLTPGARGDVGEYPNGIRAETAVGVDPAALHQAHQESFAHYFGFEPQDLAQWRRRTLDSEMFRPDLSRIAYAGGEIAAFVLCCDETTGDSVYVNLVGTRPAWRGRGLASALLADVLAAGRAAGRSSARLNVDASNPTGAVAIYERAGFGVVSEFVSYARTLR
jgi:mycothiol synthase